MQQGAALKGMGTSPRYTVGSTIRCFMGGGDDGQDLMVIGAFGSGNKENDDTHPSVKGKGNTDEGIHPDDPTHGWLASPSDQSTTSQASKLKLGNRKRNDSLVNIAQNISKAGGSGNKRTSTRYKDGSIASGLPFNNAKSAQAFIKSSINNKAAAIPQMNDMLQNLQKLSGSANPQAIAAVGAGLFQQASQFILKLRQKEKDSSKENEELLQRLLQLAEEAKNIVDE